MASISTFYHPLCTHHNHRTKRQAPRRHSVRSLTVISCQKQKLPEEMDGMIQRTVSRMISEAGKIGKNLKPEKKGDVKDLMLMSLSFALYVYISQQLVCAYFAWLHIRPKREANHCHNMINQSRLFALAPPSSLLAVTNSSETFTAIKSPDSEHGMVIVGRGGGRPSIGLTTGLNDW